MTRLPAARAALESLAARHAELAAAGQADPRLPSSWRFARPDPAGLRHAAVLILFGRLDDQPAHNPHEVVPEDLDVLFVQRADTLRQHAGQVAFPGGKVDPGDDGAIGAALREAEEETGLDPAGVDVIGELNETELPVSNFLVTPVLGWWARPSAVGVVDPGESAHVFRVPVADLLDARHRVSAVVVRGENRYASPAFSVDDTPLIWGFTAIVLSRLFDELGWTLPWDATRELRVN
ncbi:NUDIX hydrolase [Zhihengliuella flava]|uniref:8-oxo-dGTP pyrophosphatase MutT (NUDIX family) n=1 Tax=Zhihengliuella flava TaxID=1285193 RepID=A0A931GL65_9MICC|nr:CoA pyrophosphatase [Zhihengliuella flava]MBG6084169.1 8-oxo-dGTP pyrophosphatase MutT (NUDIX family) [Zhihengliuella flava]